MGQAPVMVSMPVSPQFVRLERPKDPLTDQRLHQGTDTTGAVAGSELQHCELGVLGVRVHISSARSVEQAEIPQPDQSLAGSHHGAAECTSRCDARSSRGTVFGLVVVLRTGSQIGHL